MLVESTAEHKVDAARRAVHALGAQRALVFMNWQHRLKDAEVRPALCSAVFLAWMGCSVCDCAGRVGQERARERAVPPQGRKKGAPG